MTRWFRQHAAAGRVTTAFTQAAWGPTRVLDSGIAQLLATSTERAQLLAVPH